MGKCATKGIKTVRRFAGGGALDSAIALGAFDEERQKRDPLQDQLNTFDRKIALDTAMSGLSNTERYQLENPNNQAYKAGAPAPGSSAAASADRQRTSIMQTVRDGIAGQMGNQQKSPWIGGGTESATPTAPVAPSISQGLPAKPSPIAPISSPSMAGIKRVGNSFSQAPGVPAFADGGVVGLIQNRKRLIDEAAGESDPNAIIKADPPSAGVKKPSMGSQADDYAAQAAKIEAEQLAATKARMTQPKKKGFLGFANGGKIQGPGTPTSDSIPARVKETGEPIAVSNKERIVSDKQEMLLQQIAQGLGFDSVDAMFEAGTGKPVGPTIKAGKKSPGYATGGKPDDIDAQVALAGFRKLYGNNPQAAAPIPAGTVQSAPAVERKLTVAEMEAKRKPWLAPVVNTLGAGIDAVGDFVNTVVNGPPAVRAPAEQAATPAAVPASTGQKTFGIDYGMGQPQPAQPATAQPAQPEMAPAQPASAGTATFRGKTVSLPKNEGYVDAAGNPTDDWTKTDRYAQQMNVNERMSNLARQMERDRYGRDMQADITNPKVIALAKLNLDRMNQEDEMQQQGIASGLDSRIKQNALAQSDQEQQMIARLNDPSLTPDQRLALRSDLLAMKGKNPNEHRFYVGDDETTGIDGARTKKAVLLDALSPEGRMNGRKKLPLPQGMTAENVIAEAQKAIKSGKSPAAIAAELEKYGLSLS